MLLYVSYVDELHTHRTIGPCVGNTPAQPSIAGFNGLCLQGTPSVLLLPLLFNPTFTIDSPVGVRYADGTSVFPP